jgi:hypothetical protein
MSEFRANNEQLHNLINIWEPKLLSVAPEILESRRNGQNRSIKQIVGHMVDSASNNIHRIIHLQYQPSPLAFPDYANLGNNDRWIAIQQYQTEDWYNLVQLWKYSNLHIIHVIDNINLKKLDNQWITALNTKVALKAMVLDYLGHFELHLNEIEELINSEKNNQPKQ